MSEEKIKNNAASWLSNVGVVDMGKSFASYKEIIDYAIEDTELDLPAETINNTHYQNVKQLINDGMTKFPQPARHMDTSIGGCDVFNPYWQFGEDDDIIHPIHDISDGSAEQKGMKGMGSIYSEMIYDNQKVLWLSMGVPRFSSLADFFLGDSNGVIGTIMRDGEFSLAAAVGALTGRGLRLAVNIALWPITLSNWVGNVLTKDIPVTKYYDFKMAMPLYFRLVNSIFSALAVSMGLYGNHPGDNTAADTHAAADDEYTRDTAENVYGYRERITTPEIIRDGPSIYKILMKRNKRMGLDSKGIEDDVDLIDAQAKMSKEEKEKGNSIFGRFMSGIEDGLEGANNFIGFRVEKSADASESISNSTGESEVAQSLNSIISQQRNLAFKLAGGETGLGILDKAIDVGGAFVGGVMSGAGANAITQTVSGNGYFDIPKEWKGSEFSKNQSFSIPLRARYGDPVSILQCLYLPLALIMAASMPRAVGNNMYTSPFLVQAYCKGLFSIPLGLIRSVGIKRGGAEFGWSRANLPLALDLDVTIEDLSPTMFLTMTSNEVNFFSLTVRNTAMLDYLSTLAGIGLYSRNARLHMHYRAKVSAFLSIKNTLFDPYFLGNVVGDNLGFLKGIVQMTPFRSRPEKHGVTAF